MADGAGTLVPVHAGAFGAHMFTRENENVPLASIAVLILVVSSALCSRASMRGSVRQHARKFVKRLVDTVRMHPIVVNP